VDLRPELLPPTESVDELEVQVEEAFDRSDQDGAIAAAAWLASESGITVSADDLHGWAASIDARSAALMLLTSEQHELRRLGATREELIEISRRWLPGSPRFDSANEEWWTALFDANVPRPGASNVAFCPPAGIPDDDITPEWIVDYALAYRAVEL
jgi:hypothetical protein